MSARPLTPAMRAEQAGAELAIALIDGLLTLRENGDPEAECARLMQSALLDLAELPRRDAAATGFALVLVSPLLVGLTVEASQ